MEAAQKYTNNSMRRRMWENIIKAKGTKKWPGGTRELAKKINLAKLVLRYKEIRGKMGGKKAMGKIITCTKKESQKKFKNYLEGSHKRDNLYSNTG